MMATTSYDLLIGYVNVITLSLLMLTMSLTLVAMLATTMRKYYATYVGMNENFLQRKSDSRIFGFG